MTCGGMSGCISWNTRAKPGLTPLFTSTVVPVPGPRRAGSSPPTANVERTVRVSGQQIRKAQSPLCARRLT